MYTDAVWSLSIKADVYFQHLPAFITRGSCPAIHGELLTRSQSLMVMQREIGAWLLEAGLACNRGH